MSEFTPQELRVMGGFVESPNSYYFVNGTDKMVMAYRPALGLLKKKGIMKRVIRFDGLPVWVPTEYGLKIMGIDSKDANPLAKLPAS